MDAMIEYELEHKDKILRPLSTYHIASDKLTKLRCLAICHGHNHSSSFMRYIKGDCYWYMIDINDKCYPDYVCDVTDSEAMSYFPSDYFDIIITLHFPVGIKENRVKYPQLLKNIHRMIKSTGIIYLSELPGLFFWFLNNDEYKILKNKITDVMGSELLVFHKSLSPKKQKALFPIIMVGNYKGIRKSNVDQLLYENAIVTIEDILKDDFTIITYLENYKYIRYIKIKANK